MPAAAATDQETDLRRCASRQGLIAILTSNAASDRAMLSLHRQAVEETGGRVATASARLRQAEALGYLTMTDGSRGARSAPSSCPIARLRSKRQRGRTKARDDFGDTLSERRATAGHWRKGPTCGASESAALGRRERVDGHLGGARTI